MAVHVCGDSAPGDVDSAVVWVAGAVTHLRVRMKVFGLTSGADWRGQSKATIRTGVTPVDWARADPLRRQAEFAGCLSDRHA